MTKRQKQIAEFKSELRLPATQARRRDILRMLRSAEWLERQGR
jgi:hypothetical protein